MEAIPERKANRCKGHGLDHFCPNKRKKKYWRLEERTEKAHKYLGVKPSEDFRNKDNVRFYKKNQFSLSASAIYLGLFNDCHKENESKVATEGQRVVDAWHSERMNVSKRLKE